MKYIRITYPDINNGLGCRVTLWVSGCTHKCPGCHNQWAQDYNIGKDFDQDVKRDIIEVLDNEHVKGLTISGGDPLDQNKKSLKDLENFLRVLRILYKDKKDIWIYTGYKFNELNKSQKEVLKYCDYLVDGPFEIDKKDLSLPFRGSKNQRIIDLKDYFRKKKKFLYKIFPVKLKFLM